MARAKKKAPDHTKAQIRLSINGEAVEASFAPHKTLLEVLREDLGLTGTKHGCELGECGTCAVLVDGKPVLSCLVLGLECEGRAVETVEGMAGPGGLHPLQKAFSDLGAAQCGYCTPGFLLTAKALLEENPKPDVDEIKEALAGNLCRCTGYIKIYEAVELAAAWMRGEDAAPRKESLYGFDFDESGLLPVRAGPLNGFAGEGPCPLPRAAARAAPTTGETIVTARKRTRVVGRPYTKVDGPAKVTGQTKFADDVMLPRMLHCKLLRSKIAHAKIVSIDVSKALARPGVVAIATGADLPIPFGILPVSQDEHALCTDRVRFVGDPVAAIAALDEDAAFDALDAIDVRYEPLLPIGTIDEGLAAPPDGVPIHDYADSGNIHKLVSMEFGDTEAGFARADRIYEDLYFYEGSTHLPLEQHAAVADFGPDGKLTLWSSTQTPHYVHRALSKVLEMPAARIRVIATPNGGGFGGKSDPFNHEIVVAHLSRVTGRPVKICLTREEVFYCHRGRHPVLMQVKTGVAKDGAITAMHFRSVLDGGGYGSYGVASTYYTGALQTVTYQIPTYRFDGARVFTNKPPCGPKRGHGTPQPRFALEAQLDKIACDLGIDPAEIRRRHLQPANSLTANFLRIGSMGLGPCIDKVVAASGWKKRRGKLPVRPRPGAGLLLVPLRRGAADLLELHAAKRRAAQAGPQRRRDGVLRLDRDRAGVRLDPGLDRGGGPGHRSVRHPDRHGRHRSDSGGSGLLLLARDPDDRQRRDPGGRARARAAGRGRGEEAGDSQGARGAGGRPRLRCRGSGARHQLPGGGRAGGVQVRHAGHGRVVLAAALRGPLPRRGRGAVAGLLLLGGGRRGGGRSGDRHLHRAQGLDRARRGQVHQPGAGHGPGRGLRLHGAGRGDDGGDGVPHRRQRQRRPQVSVAPRIQEPDHPGDVAPSTRSWWRTRIPTAPSARKRSGQGPLLPIPPAVANAVFDAVGVRIDEIPVTPEKIARALKAKAQGKPPRVGPERFPQVPYPEPIHVPTPAEGGDGRAVDAAVTGAGGVR